MLSRNLIELFQFIDVVEGSVPEGCYTLVISGLEDLGSGLSEIRDSLKFIDDMDYKLEVLYDYDPQLADVDCLLEIKEMLEKRCGLPVILWDERLTTVAADRSMMETGIRRENRKEYVDEIAAIFILQGYLDYLSNHPEEK